MKEQLEFNVETAVREKYQIAAQKVSVGLCYPAEYNHQDLDHIPEEIIQKDYGCGDPTRYVYPGETVVDLGSGVGKNCYIIAKKVGAKGQVIGVDLNDDMLQTARKYVADIGQTLGYSNVSFVKGKIQDLQLNLDLAETWLQQHPITNVEDLSAWETECDRLRKQSPLIPDSTVDVVVSNCVLNLVEPAEKQQLFREIYRVLKPGGRVVISDVVCDEDPNLEILNNPELWSGCIAGAFREDLFLKMFEQVGFYGISILKRSPNPVETIDGIEFRSMTIQAFKGKEGDCWERNQAVIYQGPWKQVQDDDKHTFKRGERTAVCDKTYRILTNPQGPYHQEFIPVPPYTEISLELAQPFNCQGSLLRHPKETKGDDYQVTIFTGSSAGSCCSPQQSCCS
ncbi:methyltransferase domain-containing protein [Merismopedia glauca]|uniref:Arsenite methyltransferase n=1 Tax=Merismopedia glauca CCAP 1448/3 TaxID=1296344 RepID=A0A2T1C6L4_9CYAN|nr:methyltransferase domain-containing protein [Merismopedia glauca]PSB03874.1 methyltransferase [Merismopedia glauca CCAP 1448/3]